MAQQHHGNTSYGLAQQPSQPPRVYMATQETLLLLYVVDYCEKRGYNESATVLRREGRLAQDAKPPTDSKEGLLYEWWICFWDIYTARVHPEKATSTKAAKLYAESLHHPQFARPRDGGQASNVRMSGPPPPGSAAHSAPGVNGQGQGPSGAPYGTNAPGMNGVQPTPTNSGAMPGMPAANPSMLNPTLQHLQQQRIPGYSAQGPGMQIQPVYIQRAPGTQGPTGAPMGAMGQMGQPQQRMPNDAAYAPNRNYRPQPGQQSPQQQQEMQATGASGSPKQPGGPSMTQNSSPHLQGANGNAYDASGMEHGPPRNQPSRGQKRPSPAEDDQYLKDASPPDRKKFKKSPQEHGPALPTTPLLASAQPQPGNGRPPPMQAGAFNGMPPNKSNTMMGGMSFPAQIMTNGSSLGGQGMPPAMAGQLQAHPQHAQRPQGATPQQTHQTDQQYFTQMQQTAITTYNINKPTYPPQQNPTLTGPPGVAAEPTVRGATIAPKGSMLPPPPPNTSTGQSTPGTGNSTPSKNTPVMSGLQPRNASNKDSSSPGEGVSPDAWPGSRPIPGSTPQMTPAPIPGAASTPGGPSAISAPSPSQMATPQQISRPQTQSPSQAAMARPSSATMNGLPGGGGPPPTPSAILARFGGVAPPGGTNGAAVGALAGPTPSNAGMGSSNDMLVGGPLPNDLFMSLNNNVPFDLQMQMMGYQEDDPFTTNMGLDFSTNFGMDESYNMSMYINDSSLDNGA